MGENEATVISVAFAGAVGTAILFFYVVVCIHHAPCILCIVIVTELYYR